MNVHALIVEQLDLNGTLKSFRFEVDPNIGKLIIAFPDEYDDPRAGPFYFTSEKYEEEFTRQSATCKVRKVGRSNLYKEHDEFHFRSTWRGIPSERDFVSYYAISLPIFAIPSSVHIRNPRETQNEFRRSVIRDDQKHRFVIYLECRSKFGVFDFDLECTFQVDETLFEQATYADKYTGDPYANYDIWTYMLPEEQTQKVQNFFIQEYKEGDTYSAQQVGAMGPNARATDITFDQKQFELAHDIRPILDQLAEELEKIQRKMEDDAKDSRNGFAIKQVAVAKEAAKAGDGLSVLKHLRVAGKWALDAATQIGTNLAADIIRKSIGF